MNFGFIPLASEFLDAEKMDILIKDYVHNLENAGGKRLTAENINNSGLLFYFAVTGGTESSILELFNQRRNEYPNDPVLIIAHPTNNSLPASMEVLARLQQENVPGRIFYLSGPDDKEGFSSIVEIVEDIVIYNKLKDSKVGVLGIPSDWLIASKPDSETVKKQWGPDVINIDFEEVWASLETVEKQAVSAYNSALQSEAEEVVEPKPGNINEAVKIYLAFKSIVEKYKLDAITVRCFDLVKGIESTGCFGLAELTDEGITAGCEGDLVSTIAMLWIEKLLNKPSWMANPSQVDKAGNSLVLAHCTVPKTMVKDYKLRSHFESGLGVGIQGTLPNGDVTLIRIGGRNMEKIWMAEGEIVSAGNSEKLCRTQVTVKLSNGGTVKDLLLAPLGNHIVLVYGHHLKRLTSWKENIKTIYGI